MGHGPFRPGQHVRAGSSIVEICGPRDNRYGGSYTVRRIWPRGHGVDEFAQSARTQEWLLRELTETDLCRAPVGGNHHCALIHVAAHYRVEDGV